MTNVESFANDPEYLRRYQYQNGSNLDARIILHKLFSIGDMDWNSFVLGLLRLENGMRVLELGCGTAALWRSTLQRLPADLSIFLTDLSLGMVEEAYHFLCSDGRFQFTCQNAVHLTFPRQSFDLVVANHMLYHVPSLDGALASIRRVLRPAGRLVCATNGPEHMSDLDALLHEFEPAYQGLHAMSGQFSLANGEAQLRKHFGDVDLALFPSDLWITDAILLAAYAFSTPRVKETIAVSRLPEMVSFFQERIDLDGGISVRKQTGVYLASEPLD